MKKLSVITACFNSGPTIASCIGSRQRMLGANVRHIVQDGGSSDQTLEVVKSMQDGVIDIESERDKGIYDALNKAVARVETDWLMFLHSDDEVSYPGVLEDIERAESEGARALSYGVSFVNGTGRIFRRWQVTSYRRSSFRYGFMLPHTGLVVRRELFERYGGFRLDLGSAADYEWMLRVFFKGGEWPMVMPGKFLVQMKAGGASDASFNARLKANRFDMKAWHINGLSPSLFFRVLKPMRKIRQFV